MMMRLIEFAVGAAAVLLCCPAGAEETTRPNILFIFCDDMGYGDLTCYGDGIGVETTHIDKLASEGIRFTQAYVASPICSPSRAGLITGRYPGSVGINTFLHTRQHNTQFEQADYLDPAYPMLPRVLKDAGYVTGHFGKWHLGGGRDVRNAPSILDYGYDEYVTTFESPDPDPKLGVHPPWENRNEPEKLPKHERTGYVMDRAVDFMSRQKGKPWFASVWTEDIHATWNPSPEMQKKYGGSEKDDRSIENLRGVLDEYDQEVGRLLDNVTSMGLAENTLVIFMSDNGPFPKHEGRTAGLRGRKGSLYEGGIRVPFIVRWPNVAPAGAVNSKTVFSALDFFPTLAKVAGAELPAEVARDLDGVDMTAALRGESPERSGLHFWEFGRGGKNDKKNPEVSPQVAVREGDWKLLANPAGPHRELYDLAVDPKEENNVAAQHPEVADRLTSAAREWRKSLPVMLRDEATSETFVKGSRR